jgi:hypothetical protein
VDRPQKEREFEFALQSLHGESESHDRLVDLGVAAWWAANQSLTDTPEADYFIRRFLNALDQLTTHDSDAAADFTAFRGLLVRTVQDQRRIEERCSSIQVAVLEHLNARRGNVTVVVRDNASARVVRSRLAAQIECDVAELPQLGVHVRSGRTLVSMTDPGLVVASGFSGFTSIDSILASRAPFATLVMDPIEAALAVSTSRRTEQWLGRTGVSRAAVAAIENAAKAVAIRGYEHMLSPRFDIFESIAPFRIPTAKDHRAVEKQRYIITFVDGDAIIAEAGRRFDRIEPSFGMSRSIAVESLGPGDEVVLVDDASLFSERLIRSLDEGPLKAEVTQRATWVTMVKAVVDSERIPRAAVHRRLAAKGVRVDYQTVRTWTSPSNDDDRVPATWEHFHALAEVVGISLPEGDLRAIFRSIQLIRTRHRASGRQIVRMIRAARTGRLDPRKLHEIESLFGLSVRELVEATRVAIIDDVQMEN